MLEKKKEFIQNIVLVFVETHHNAKYQLNCTAYFRNVVVDVIGVAAIVGHRWQLI